MTNTIESVFSDMGEQTEFLLKSRDQCVVFAVSDASVKDLGERSYHSFVRLLSHNEGKKAINLEEITINKKKTIRFEQDTGNMVAAYILDETNKAGIWASCTGPDNEKLKESASTFMSSIEGSARKY